MIDIDNFQSGLSLLEDSTKSPIGSAREMVNMMISDRGGITKRGGTLLLGTKSTATGTTGLYNFKKSDGTTKVPIRAYSTYSEYFHPTLLDWYRLESGFTAGKEWGFSEHLVNSDNEDYVYLCNGYEDYRRWSGWTTTLSGALAGGETTITVADNGLIKDTNYSGTADSCTTTTIDVAGTPWATDQWNNFYVKITSGATSGTISHITDTDNNTITFDVIAGLSGTPTFEIRINAVPATGTLVIGNNEVAYTAIPANNQFTVGSAPASADGSPVTIKPTAYPAAPKGNILTNYFTRMIVGNVSAGIATDSSGNRQGSQSYGSVYVSKLKNATDFSYTLAGRVAGEGDIFATPYGGGRISDILQQEDLFYVLKEDYIEGDTYTQDSNDVLTRTPIKQGVGVRGKGIKGKDNIYFVTNRNEITTIGRLATKDTTPQTENIGISVKRLLDTLDFTKHRGIEYKDRVLFACKTSDSTTNNRTLVFNRTTNSFEGYWLLPAWGFMLYGDNPYYIDSVTPNVYRMFYGTNDVQGSDIFGISASWKSNYFNLTKSGFDLMSCNAYGAEGYIKGGTSIIFKLFKDFNPDEVISFTFSGTESGLIDSTVFGEFLGIDPMGITYEGSVDEPDDEGWSHFLFTMYFPDTYGTKFSVGVENYGENQSFEISRLALGITSDNLAESTRVKTS